MRVVSPHGGWIYMIWDLILYQQPGTQNAIEYVGGRGGVGCSVLGGYVCNTHSHAHGHMHTHSSSPVCCTPTGV